MALTNQFLRTLDCDQSHRTQVGLDVFVCVGMISLGDHMQLLTTDTESYEGVGKWSCVDLDLLRFDPSSTVTKTR